MLQFDKTFMDFLLEHQERHNRTYHFLILMNSILNAAKRIQFYYQTGALRGNLGLAGSINVQGEDVMKMDEIANDLVKHYLQSSGRVIYAIGEEDEDRIEMNMSGGRYFVYYDPMDGSSNVPHNLPIGCPFRRRQAQSRRARGHAPPGRARIHRFGNVRHSHRDVHHRPAPGGLLAVPHRRDDELRQADEDGSAGRPQELGNILQFRQPRDLRPGHSEVDRGKRKEIRLPLHGRLWPAISTGS